MIPLADRHDYSHGDFGGEERSAGRVGAMVGCLGRRPAHRRVDQRSGRPSRDHRPVRSSTPLVLLSSTRDLRCSGQRTRRRLPQQRDRHPDGLPHPSTSLAEAQDADPSATGARVLLRTVLRRQGHSRHTRSGRQLPFRTHRPHSWCSCPVTTGSLDRACSAGRGSPARPGSLLRRAERGMCAAPEKGIAGAAAGGSRAGTPCFSECSPAAESTVVHPSGCAPRSAAMVRAARSHAAHRAPSRVRTTLTGGSVQVVPCQVQRASRKDTLSGSSPSGKSGHSSIDVIG